MAGNEQEIDRDRLRKNDIMLGMLEDVASCKRELMRYNNEGKLNIEMLTVVGGDVGALVALNWAAYDWTRPQLPTLKQGHNVKAFVLLTPTLNFKGRHSPGRRQLGPCGYRIGRVDRGWHPGQQGEGRCQTALRST